MQHPVIFNIVLEVLAGSIRQDKKTKGIQIGKEVVKLSLFADDKILCIRDSKNSTRKLLEIINKFHIIAGYRISMQKLIYFYSLNTEK